MTNKLNKDGSLTAYAFACGYVEEKGNYKLFKDGCFHIQGAGLWLTFSTLTEARKAFRKLSKHTHQWVDAYKLDGETVNGAECLECSFWVASEDWIG